MPADYVIELATRAFQQIQENSLTGREIVVVIEETPADASALSAKLFSRPDLQAHLASLTGYTPSQWILERELVQINERRAHLQIHPVDPSGSPYERAASSGLTGLCFSGGGIRSATFNLGILQGLAELNLLRCFDYLSTVSGGGYIHQWFAAWAKRRGFETVEKELIPLPETGSPPSHPEPIRWLRRYSNYLTPQKGIFSADTWVAIAIWTRNTLLNQITLFAGLFFLALALHSVSFCSIVPHRGPAVAAVVGAIVFLSVLAVYFVGKELSCFGTRKAALGQGGVRWWVVFPWISAAFLLTLLFAAMSDAEFGFHLIQCSLASMLLFFILALTITLSGRAPLAYLKSHHRTSAYKSVGEFWRQPKCLIHLKFIIAMGALLAICALAALAGGLWIFGSLTLVGQLWHFAGPVRFSRVVLVVQPPLVVMGFLVSVLLVVGLLGRTFQNARREWLSRLSAQFGLSILFWVLLLGSSLFGHDVVLWLCHKAWVGLPTFLGWFATSLGGLLAGKSSKVSGTESVKGSKFGGLEVLALIGPFVFIAGLLLLISALAEVVVQRGVCVWLIAVCLSFVVSVLFAWRVDVNEFSLHAFYRNRLSRCYMGASHIPRHPNPFTGFDEADTEIAVSDLLPSRGYDGPFPIFCTTLNLTFGEDLAWQERKAASFAFTPLYSGYDVPWTGARGVARLRFNGYLDTATYAYPRPGIHINTAVAISGAALSPNMGYHTSPAVSFLMTVFSVRLGWWLRNPRVLNEDGTKLNAQAGLRGDSKVDLLRNPYPSPSPVFSLVSLSKELLGRTNDTSNYVYLSDGGHFENMGLYELVRRRCRYIVICDAEDDGDLKFGGIGMAVRRCRIDFGAEIELDLRPLQHAEDSQYSSAHCVVGTVRYPGQDEPGIVVYIKSSLTGDEPGDIANYKEENAAFPDDTTLNQWFSESQFESYRRLGHHIAFSVLEPAGSHATDCVCRTFAGRRKLFTNLKDIWCAPTPEMDHFTAAHTERYQALLEKARTDAQLPGLFAMMFGKGTDWKTDQSQEEIEYAVQFSSELIEFIWMVFTQLDLVLPEKRNHPYAKGWSRIFTKWARIDVVRDGWIAYRDSYSPTFRRFAESDSVGLPRES